MNILIRVIGSFIVTSILFAIPMVLAGLVSLNLINTYPFTTWILTLIAFAEFAHVTITLYFHESENKK